MAELACLVEIVVLKQEHARVRVVRLSPIDANQVELPQPAAVALRIDIALDRYLVANAPAITFRKTRRCHRAGAGLAKRFELLGRYDPLGIQREIALGIDGELGKKVARLLIYAAEPVRMRHGSDAWDRVDL